MSETVVARLRPHPRALFWPCVLLVIVAGGFGYFTGLREAWQVIVVCVAAVALVVLGFLVPLLRYLSVGYTITTRRIAVRSGILVRSRQELLLSRAHDVSLRRTALQAMFRTGDVRVGTAIDRPLVLHDVPAAALVQETLHDLMERNRSDRSIG